MWTFKFNKNLCNLAYLHDVIMYENEKKKIRNVEEEEENTPDSEDKTLKKRICKIILCNNRLYYQSIYDIN